MSALNQNFLYKFPEPVAGGKRKNWIFSFVLSDKGSQEQEGREKQKSKIEVYPLKLHLYMRKGTDREIAGNQLRVISFLCFQ